MLFEKGIDFTKEFSTIMGTVKDDVVVSIGSGIQRHGKKKGLTKERYGRCTDSYILHKKFLDICKEEECYTMNIGHFMNKLLKESNTMWTYYEPTIFCQGSQNGTYATDIRDF